MRDQDHGLRTRFGTTWSVGHFDGEIAFATLRRHFEQAAATRPGGVHRFSGTFGGETVLMRIVGDELAEHICRPFSHLRTGGSTGAPRLTIDLWDDSGTWSDGAAAERRPWTETTVTSADGRFLGQRLPYTVSCLDRDAGHIVAAIEWHDRMYIYERAKPLARPLLEWHNDRGIQVIHTGLVARDGKGVLLAGKSGSGKSTSSLACARAGFDYLSEDYAGLQNHEDGSFTGHSLYNSVFLETSHLARFPELMPYAITGRLPEEEKSVIILSQVFPERLARSVSIRALALLRVTDTPALDVRPAPKGEALLALGVSSLLQLPNRSLGSRGLDILARLVERVPCYRLEVGSDFAAIAHRVESLLAEVP